MLVESSQKYFLGSAVRKRPTLSDVYGRMRYLHAARESQRGNSPRSHFLKPASSSEKNRLSILATVYIMRKIAELTEDTIDRVEALLVRPR